MRRAIIIVVIINFPLTLTQFVRLRPMVTKNRSKIRKSETAQETYLVQNVSRNKRHKHERKETNENISTGRKRTHYWFVTNTLELRTSITLHVAE